MVGNLGNAMVRAMAENGQVKSTYTHESSAEKHHVKDTETASMEHAQQTCIHKLM